MEDMIKRILEIDREARNMTADAEKSRVKAQAEVSQQAEKIHEQYMQSANAHIAQLEETERQRAAQRLEAGKERLQKQLDALEAQFASHRDEWINTIVEQSLAD